MGYNRDNGHWACLARGDREVVPTHEVTTTFPHRPSGAVAFAEGLSHQLRRIPSQLWKLLYDLRMWFRQCLRGFMEDLQPHQPSSTDVP